MEAEVGQKALNDSLKADNSHQDKNMANLKSYEKNPWLSNQNNNKGDLTKQTFKHHNITGKICQNNLDAQVESGDFW